MQSTAVVLHPTVTVGSITQATQMSTYSRLRSGAYDSDTDSMDSNNAAVGDDLEDEVRAHGWRAWLACIWVCVLGSVSEC